MSRHYEHLSVCVVLNAFKALLTDLYQSFANISKVTTDQLQTLPGFGQVKVNNIKNAFKKPFRNQTTTPLSMRQIHKSGGSSQAKAVLHNHDQPIGHISRESSPIWDIELDEGGFLSHDSVVHQNLA